MKNNYIVFVLLCFFLVSFKGNHNDENLERKGKDHAIFFAVNNYQDNGWEDLKTPIRDAEEIANLLKTKYGFTTEVIKNPSKYQINKKLKSLSKRKYQEDSQLLIYFTGHGIFDPAPGEKEKGLGYFIPSDARADDEFRDSYLGYVKLNPIIDNNPCKHILVSIDACYSGSFFNYKNRPNELTQREKLIRDVMSHTSRIGLTSGNFSPVKSGRHFSPYARNFISALSSGGGTDQILTVTELYSFLENISPRPQRGYFGKHHPEGDFLFIKKKTRSNPNSGNRQVDLLAWKKAEQSNTIYNYEQYLKEFPNGIFIGQAEQKMSELEEETEWEIAQTLNTPSAYEGYLKNYPYGKYASTARRKLKNKSRVDYTQTSGTFIDSRDGQSYRWAKMKDGKIWMTENLNYEKPGSYCYGDKESNCIKYGRLYKWSVAKKVCPEEWDLPNKKEWEKLVVEYGGYRYYEGESKDNGNPQKTYNNLTLGKFSILLGGYRSRGGEFFNLEEFGPYWTATANGRAYAWNYNFDKAGGRVHRYNDYSKESGFSCRCIKD